MGLGCLRYAAALLIVATASHAADLVVSTDFPCGAAAIQTIDQSAREIVFKIPTARTGGWQSWWYFKVSGITPGETISLHQTNGTAPALRAVYSIDGKTWKYTDPIPYEERKKPVSYRQKIDAEQAWFAWYVPYGVEQANALIEKAAKQPFVKTFELCKSEEGVAVMAMEVAEGENAADRPQVWVHARQHAWEVGGSWTAHGLGEWLISDDPRAASLRKSARVTLVPIMDVDSVQGGRGGKDQKPYDHNRDWIDSPRWAAVQAAMKRVKEMDAAGKLVLFLDLHDPGWAGAVEFWCHTYPTMNPTRKFNTDLFLAAGRQEITGPLVFNGRPTVKYSLTTPTSGIWASSKTSEKVVGGTFEIGVAPPKGHDDPPPSHHLICGKQIGLAIERFIAGERK